MINVTQSLMPNRERFHAYVDKILDSGWLTNYGQHVSELESKLEEYLGVRNVVLVNNATSGLQVAYKALDLCGEVISTPFTFIATASSAVWGGLDISFADIHEDSLNIDVSEIESRVSKRTSAIMPVHVFGNPCDVEAIEVLADKYHLKVIYDAAHAFGVKYKGESILRWGDISVLSFHATKLFHTIEGGALIIKDDALCKKVRNMINFGITDPESIECLGINAKMNEFQAVMGLCLLDDVDATIARRRELVILYDDLLSNHVMCPRWIDHAGSNYAYYPVIFESERVLKRVQSALNAKNIFPRRYFYPSLDTLPFICSESTSSISRDISSRILCLPLYAQLSENECEIIANTVLLALEM